MKLLSLKSLIAKTSLSRAQIQRMVKAKTMPAPMKITPRRVVWIEHVIDDWIVAISGQSGTNLSNGGRYDFV